MRSGYIHPASTTGTFRFAGINGAWWSSYAVNNLTNSYYLHITDKGVSASYYTSYYYRYYGNPLRCLSTVLGM